MKILLLGRSGQVGWELKHSLASLGAVAALGREEADLEKLDILRTIVRECAPEVIVNAAAFTAVDRAEAEPERAMLVNCDAVRVLAEESRRLGAWLIHYSTDYVFDGSKLSPYVESDQPDPLNTYGRTKLAGEYAIQSSSCRHLIFRTSWVYSGRGTNFARTILRIARERYELKVVSDQFGAPTSAALIAHTTALCLGAIMQRTRGVPDAEGIYHLTAAGVTSWYEYACFVVQAAIKSGIQVRLTPCAIRPIATSEYPLPAKRPANSRLATDKISKVFRVEFPHWQIDLKRVVQEIAAVEGA